MVAGLHTQGPGRGNAELVTVEEKDETVETTAVSYEFEPSPEDILNRLLPRYVEAAIFNMLLEASASEHSARRRAMKAATDNAEELIRTLTVQRNRARQAEITTAIPPATQGDGLSRQCFVDFTT